MYEKFGKTFAITDFLAKLNDANGDPYTQQADATDDYYYWLVVQVADKAGNLYSPNTINDT